MNIALILAAGSGSRMKQDIPKQFLTVHEKPVIVYTMEAFQKHPEIDKIAVVCLEGWEPMVRAYGRQFSITKLCSVIPGGKTGQDSIRIGIAELQTKFDKEDFVLVHDGNRPLVTAEIISDNLSVARKYGNAITAIPCSEAILETDDGLTSTTDYQRERLKRTQTPQALRLGELAELHREALQQGIADTVASCTLMIALGRKVYFSRGSEKNIKLTTVEDIDIFKALLTASHEEWYK